MNLEKMLEYQKIDQEIYKVELDLNRSKEMARINNFKNQLSLAQNTLLKLNKETEELFHTIETLEKDILNSSPEKGFAENANTPEKVNSAEQTLNECLESLATIEKESKRAFDRLTYISREAAKQYEVGRHLSGEHKKAKEQYNLLLSKIREEHKHHFEQLNELASQIDPKLLAKYKHLRDHRRMPAIVPYMGGNCAACGMDISIEVSEKLKTSGDLAECPNCRRLVYLK